MAKPGNDVKPTAPVPPEPGDCCGDGCARCVNDVYAAAFDRYEADAVAWRHRQQCDGDEDEQPGLSSGASPV